MPLRQYLLQILATALLAVAVLTYEYALFTLPSVPDPSPYAIEPGGAFALFYGALFLLAALAVVLSLAWWRFVGAVVVGIAAGVGLAGTAGMLASDNWLMHAMPGMASYIAAAAILCGLSCTVATSVVVAVLIRGREPS
jgi:hypothetical protein